MEIEDWELEERFHKITLMDLVAKKAAVEEEGKMSVGLAACFSHAAKLLREDPNIFYEYQLILQGGGTCVDITPHKCYCRRILWYDEYLKVVHDDMDV